MKEKIKNLKETIEYDIIHPVLSQSSLDRFEPFLPRIWPKCVLMFHAGRSGSTVLGDLLAQTEEIYWDGEIYEPFFKHLKKQGWNFKIDKFFLTNSLKLLRNHMAVSKLLNYYKIIYGFEVKFFHLRRLDGTIENYLTYLEKKLGFKYFIILERKNYLRKIVSSIISNQKLKKFHLTEQEKSQIVRCRIDINNIKIDGERKSLLTFLQDFQNDFQKLETLLRNHRVLKLTYEEDICQNPLMGAQKVCKFLDIEYQGGIINYKKTNPFDLKSILINYDEVKQNLHGTVFEWMLYDD